MNRIRTDILEIAFEEDGPADGIPILLLHGWPDSPRGWIEVSRRLHAEGYRTIAPYLRGSSPTNFLSKDTPRVGAGVALAQGEFAILGSFLRLSIEYIVFGSFHIRVVICNVDPNATD
jgi:pimeloyl-ACP methyl ester carboxylesterase